MISGYEESKRFLRHEPCPECGSRDNVSVWWNETLGGETSYCYTCHKGKSDADLAREQGRLGGIVPTGDPLSEEMRIERGLKRETVTKYDIRQSGKEVYFPYRFPGGKCADIKIRDYSKQKNEPYHFYWKASAKNRPLFGMHCASGRKHLILTTGEWDAPAAHDMTGWNAVHVGGDDEAIKQVKVNLAWIDQYETIFVCFDNDVSGQASAHVVCELIGYKARNVLLPSYSTKFGVTKDASDYCRAKLASEFQSACWAAKSLQPNYIYDHDEQYIDELYDFLTNPEQHTGYSTGIQPLDELIGGLRQGEVSVIMAAPGEGKSTLSRYIMANLIGSKQARCLYISLEERAVIARTRVIETLIQQQIIRRGQTTEITREELARLVEPLRDTLINTNFLGSVSEDAIVNAITYAAKGSDVKFVLLDHIGAATNDSDQMWRTISGMMDKLNQLAMNLQIHICIITHSGRRSPEYEHLPPRMQDAFGSSGIERYTHVFLALTREDNCVTIHVLKNRLWGDLGKVTVYYSDGRYYGSPTIQRKKDNLPGENVRQRIRSDVCENVSLPKTERRGRGQPETDLSVAIPPITGDGRDPPRETHSETGTETSQDDAPDPGLLCDTTGRNDMATGDERSNGSRLPPTIAAIQEAAPHYLLALPAELSRRIPAHPKTKDSLHRLRQERARNGLEGAAQSGLQHAQTLVDSIMSDLIGGMHGNTT